MVNYVSYILSFLTFIFHRHGKLLSRLKCSNIVLWYDDSGIVLHVTGSLFSTVLQIECAKATHTYALTIEQRCLYFACESLQHFRHSVAVETLLACYSLDDF